MNFTATRRTVRNGWRDAMSTALNWPSSGNGIHLHWWAAEKQTEPVKEETMKNLPKMRDPYLTSQDIDLVFDLPGAVENFLKVWKPGAETREAFMIQNFELIGEARDKVLPGWDGEDYED